MKKLVLWILGWYRQYRSLRPDACRFDPTCSAYAQEAVERHGARKGLYLGTRRIMRCHPLGGSGYDPVPAESPAIGNSRRSVASAEFPAIGNSPLADSLTPSLQLHDDPGPSLALVRPAHA